MYDFITGFETPKFKRYDEFFAGAGALEGGGTGNQAGIVDYDTIPYARNNYYCGNIQLGNTGFGRVHFELNAGALTTQAVGSFYLKFNGEDGTVRSSAIYVMRDGSAPGKRIIEIASRQDPSLGFEGFGSIEIWSSNSAGEQSNSSGSLVGYSAPRVLRYGVWHHVEVLFVSGAVTVFVDGMAVATGTALGTYITRHGFNWEAFGFSRIVLDDYVFQTGSDSSLLGTGHRVTTLWPTSDVLNYWYSTGYPHYSQVQDRETPDTSTYIAPSPAGYELFGWERAYPVGSILAVQVSIAALPKSATTSSSVHALFRQGPSGALVEYGQIIVPPYIARETTEAQRMVSASTIKVLDPNSGLWLEDDWIGNWFVGLTNGSGPAQVTQLVVERLHRSSGGAGARYISY